MKGALSTLSADSARVLTLQGQLIQEVVLAEELQKAENQQERCLRHLEAEVLAEAAAGPSSVARHDCNDFWEASTEQHEDQNMQALLRQAGSFLFGNLHQEKRRRGAVGGRDFAKDAVRGCKHSPAQNIILVVLDVAVWPNTRIRCRSGT